jgi:hypothetical protein
MEGFTPHNVAKSPPLNVKSYNFGGNEVFSLMHHFVQCWGVLTRRKPAPLLGVVF